MRFQISDLRHKNFNEKGFTLIELVIYSVLVLIVGIVAISIFLQIINLGESSRRTREELDNAGRSLDIIAQEVRHAKSVYTPTSVFFPTNPGQLSLETTRDLPTDENSTYVDFYVDDGGIYVKREGQAVELITSEKINVTDLEFTYLSSSNSNPSVKIKLTAEFKGLVAGFAKPVTLESTATLRSY